MRNLIKKKKKEIVQLQKQNVFAEIHEIRKMIYFLISCAIFWPIKDEKYVTVKN